MNTTLLTRFVAAAEELHFPRAAEALGISLPALYSSIDKLETEIGHPLFARDQTPPRLTKAGILLLAEARNASPRLPTRAASPSLPPAERPRPRKGRAVRPW